MSLQSEMEHNALWLKENKNPDAMAKFRFYGYNYIMKRVPNQAERIEMV